MLHTHTLFSLASHRNGFSPFFVLFAICLSFPTFRKQFHVHLEFIYVAEHTIVCILKIAVMFCYSFKKKNCLFKKRISRRLHACCMPIKCVFSCSRWFFLNIFLGCIIIDLHKLQYVGIFFFKFVLTINYCIKW